MKTMNAVMAAALRLVEAVEASQNPELDAAERTKASEGIERLVKRFGARGIGVLFQDAQTQPTERGTGKLVSYLTLHSRAGMTRKKAAAQLSPEVDIDLLVSPLESGLLTLPVEQPRKPSEKSQY